MRDVWGDLGRDKQRVPGFAALVAGLKEGPWLSCLARFWGQVRRLRDVWGDVGRDKQRGSR